MAKWKDRDKDMERQLKEALGEKGALKRAEEQRKAAENAENADSRREK